MTLQLEDLITREVQLARQLVAQKRQSQALIALKKKKVQEGRVDNIDKWLLNVEEMVSKHFGQPTQDDMPCAMQMHVLSCHRLAVVLCMLNPCRAC